MTEPDYVYDPDDWEYTQEWADRNDLAESCEVEFEGVYRFKTLIQGPDRFCARVNNEYQWFESRAEAEAAWKADGRSPQDTKHDLG